MQSENITYIIYVRVGGSKSIFLAGSRFLSHRDKLPNSEILPLNKKPQTVDTFLTPVS
jgi:hypothetical protein